METFDTWMAFVEDHGGWWSFSAFMTTSLLYIVYFTFYLFRTKKKTPKVEPPPYIPSKTAQTIVSSLDSDDDWKWNEERGYGFVEIYLYSCGRTFTLQGEIKLDTRDREAIKSALIRMLNRRSDKALKFSLDKMTQPSPVKDAPMSSSQPIISNEQSKSEMLWRKLLEQEDKLNALREMYTLLVEMAGRPK